MKGLIGTELPCCVAFLIDVSTRISALWISTFHKLAFHDGDEQSKCSESFPKAFCGASALPPTNNRAKIAMKRNNPTTHVVYSKADNLDGPDLIPSHACVVGRLWQRHGCSITSRQCVSPWLGIGPRLPHPKDCRFRASNCKRANKVKHLHITSNASNMVAVSLGVKA